MVQKKVLKKGSRNHEGLWKHTYLTTHLEQRAQPIIMITIWIISDFLTPWSKRWLKVMLWFMMIFRFSSIDETCKNELKRSPLPLRFQQEQNSSLFYWHLHEWISPIHAGLAQPHFPIQTTSTLSGRVSIVHQESLPTSEPDWIQVCLAGKLLFVSSNEDWYQEQTSLQEVIASVEEVIS